jgi:hypothetical protein
MPGADPDDLDHKLNNMSNLAYNGYCLRARIGSNLAQIAAGLLQE